MIAVCSAAPRAASAHCRHHCMHCSALQSLVNAAEGFKMPSTAECCTHRVVLSDWPAVSALSTPIIPICKSDIPSLSVGRMVT